MTDLKPDVELFNKLLHASVVGQPMTGEEVAASFRHLFLRDPLLGRRVLFILLKWLGEYDTEIPTGEALQRWAGKREVAALVKAALFADLSTPPATKGDDE
jgi:hypothetical protein